MPTDSVHLYREYKAEFKQKQVSILTLAALLSDVKGRGGFLIFSVCRFFLTSLGICCGAAANAQTALVQTSKAI